MVALRAAEHDGLDVIVARAFNHIGPASIAGVRRLEPRAADCAHRSGRDEPTLSSAISIHGATSPTCATSCAPTARWSSAAARAAYNVCRGEALSVRDLIDALVARAGVRDNRRGSRAREDRWTSRSSLARTPGSPATPAGNPKSRSTRRWTTCSATGEHASARTKCPAPRNRAQALTACGGSSFERREPRLDIAQRRALLRRTKHETCQGHLFPLSDPAHDADRPLARP